jgi:hypothetical protein
MLSMPFAAPSSISSRSARRWAAGLLAALALAAAPLAASADTGPGAPSPPVYTGDVAAPPQAPPAQAATAGDEYADNDPSALTDFRDALDPHGTWVQDPTYGTVWVPNPAEVGADFAPYQTAGRWQVLDSGDWGWESDYDWGWAPFHYGRWVWTGGYWGWIPGRVYAPAWVEWRVGDAGYIGWAPLPPTWYWADGVAVGLWTVPWAAYCFVPTSYVFYGNVSTYVVRDPGVVRTAANGTRPYHPAHPSASHPTVGNGGHVPQHHPASPSFAAAHLPASAVPQTRVAPNTRAMALATRSSTTAYRRSVGAAPSRAAFGNQAAQSRGGNAWHNNYDGFGRRVSPSPASQAPSYPQNAGRAPAYAGRPSAPSFPSGGRAPSAAPSPSFHSAPPTFRSSAPTFHAAPSGVRTPSFHPSTSTVSRPSAPRPSSGGGAHFGGGHGGGRHR